MDDYKEEYSDDEVNLLDYWRVIWKWKILIVLVVFIVVLISTVNAVYTINTYEATAVISPVSEENSSGSLSILSQQFGGLPGISLPSSTSSSEIINLLSSKMIREKLIERFNLMPVLFSDRWDENKKEWRKEENKGIHLNPVSLIKGIITSVKPVKKTTNSSVNLNENNAPPIWSGLRKLDSIISVSNNVKNNTILVSAEFHDPETTVQLVNDLLRTVTEYMSSEAKKAADTKKRYLEGQLRSTADPIIRQKIYNLISLQVETAMMSEMKEDFAFKIIDSPRVPDRRIRPKRLKIVFLSFIVSLLIGIILAFFFEYIKKQKEKTA